MTPRRVIPVLILSVVLFTMAIAACSRSARDERTGATSTAPAVGYGTAMADVARRFEILGRAAAGGRFDLARYELGEIEEQFLQTLPHAAPPKDGHPEALPPMARAFVETSVPELRRSIAARDRAEFASAFERAARACNGCHQASGHGFIEVPGAPGRSIPNVDPVVPVSRSDAEIQPP
jgi:hypothetical protein